MAVILGLDMADTLNYVIYSTGSDPHISSVSVGDFNKDNLSDIAIANTAHTNISLRLGSGRGTFEGEIIYSTGLGSYPQYLSVDDFDNGNFTDILVANSRNDSIILLVEYRNRTFARQETYLTGNGSHPNSNFFW
ncbi:unnamed protein product [Rotaria sp. Silwood2]|nr:unnamed protein product [Rotaria sp. Silwood2]